MWLEFITLGFICTAAATGLITLHVNRHFFEDFQLHDIVKKDYDAWLYLCNNLTTAASLIDVVLRVRWVVEVGWDNSGTGWATAWLCWHILVSTCFIIVHVATNALLKRYRTLRKQP